MSREGYQQKGSSFCTKNTDIVCRQPRAALRGASWLTRSLRQLGPESPHRVPGWGLLRTAAGRGQPSCTAAPSPSVHITMGQRRALFVVPLPLQQEAWDQVSPTCTVGLCTQVPHTSLGPSFTGCPSAPESPSSLPGGQQT